MSSSWQNWVLLIIAGIFEVIWAYNLKVSKGFSVILPTVMFFLTLALSMWLLALSLKTIPISVAYPVWTGIGAIGSVIIGYLFFKEPLSLMKFLFALMVVGGIIGLKLTADR